MKKESINHLGVIMQIKLSKKQWEYIGAQAGWVNKVAKKNKKKKSSTQHGFIEQCVKENSEKDNPNAYCAAIVDRAKGTTDWRKNRKKAALDGLNEVGPDNQNSTQNINDMVDKVIYELQLDGQLYDQDGFRPFTGEHYPFLNEQEAEKWLMDNKNIDAKVKRVDAEID